MKIPRYWAKSTVKVDPPHRNPRTGKREVRSMRFWGWSETSLAEARALGRRRGEAFLELLRQGKHLGPDIYYDRPHREEILEEHRRPDGTVFSAITRNAYGCRVLNTASVMFVDVDLPEAFSAEIPRHRWQRWLGLRTQEPRKPRIGEALTTLKQVLARTPGSGARIYRTRGGLRYLITHAHADPTSDATVATLEALGADPRFVRLCRIQESFRARLSPKPWRCGIEALPVSYPRENESAEAEARSWIEAYEEKARGHATCKLLDEYGPAATDEEILRVAELHDRSTLARSGLSLA
ncbi:MAG: hypothetical protein MI919_27665 [Holophagales bacterium]|nr:hypothetical protein [Holophagales bacterium]